LTCQADRLLFGSNRVLTHIVFTNGRAGTAQDPYRSIAGNNECVYNPEQAALICTGPIHSICTGPIHSICTGPIHLICTGPIHLICTGPIHLITYSITNSLIISGS